MKQRCYSGKYNNIYIFKVLNNVYGGWDDFKIHWNWNLIWVYTGQCDHIPQALACGIIRLFQIRLFQMSGMLKYMDTWSIYFIQEFSIFSYLSSSSCWRPYLYRVELPTKLRWLVGWLMDLWIACNYTENVHDRTPFMFKMNYGSHYIFSSVCHCSLFFKSLCF